jgi:hypothetical protein
MKNLFVLQPFDRYDKALVIVGPGDLELSIDYDDVDHQKVERDVHRLIILLNEYWESE